MPAARPPVKYRSPSHSCPIESTYRRPAPPARIRTPAFGVATASTAAFSTGSAPRGFTQKYPAISNPATSAATHPQPRHASPCVTSGAAAGSSSTTSTAASGTLPSTPSTSNAYRPTASAIFTVRSRPAPA